MVRALTTKQFIAKAMRIHRNRYDYSKVYYENNRTKVCIICKVHREFWQKPNHHLDGHGCSKCVHEESYEKQKKSRKQFIQDAIRVYGEIYDYSKVDYINARTKVEIICRKHGTLCNHLIIM